MSNAPVAPTGYNAITASGLFDWLLSEEGIRLARHVVLGGRFGVQLNQSGLSAEINITRGGMNREEECIDHWFQGQVDVLDSRTWPVQSYSVKFEWYSYMNLDRYGRPLAVIYDVKPHPVGLHDAMSHSGAYTHAQSVLCLALPRLMEHVDGKTVDLAPEYVPIDESNTEWDVLD